MTDLNEKQETEVQETEVQEVMKDIHKDELIESLTYLQLQNEIAGAENAIVNVLRKFAERTHVVVRDIRLTSTNVEQVVSLLVGGSIYSIIQDDPEEVQDKSETEN